MWNKLSSYWIHNTTTYKSCYIILKFVGGGHKHTRTRAHTKSRSWWLCCHGDLSLAESCPLSQCWFVSLSSFLNFLLLPPSSSPIILFLSIMLFICLCFYLYSSLMPKWKRKGNGHGSMSSNLILKNKKLQLNTVVTCVILFLLTTFCLLCCNFYIQTYKHLLQMKPKLITWTTCLIQGNPNSGCTNLQNLGTQLTKRLTEMLLHLFDSCSDPPHSGKPILQGRAFESFA